MRHPIQGTRLVDNALTSSILPTFEEVSSFARLSGFKESRSPSVSAPIEMLEELRHHPVVNAAVELAKRFVPAKYHFLEMWVQKRPIDDNMFAHFDLSEQRWFREQIMSLPAFSSILYITDEGTATVVFNNTISGVDNFEIEPLVHLHGMDPLYVRHGELIVPKRNRYAIFDGRRLHGVLPLCCDLKNMPTGTRATLLVNFWDLSVANRTFERPHVKTLRKLLKMDKSWRQGNRHPQSEPQVHQHSELEFVSTGARPLGHEDGKCEIEVSTLLLIEELGLHLPCPEGGLAGHAAQRVDFGSGCANGKCLFLLPEEYKKAMLARMADEEDNADGTDETE